MSPRQFGSAFRPAAGETPARAVERRRVEAARLRLEEGMESIELIARSVGFGDLERLGRAFVKRIGLSPRAVRQTIRTHRAPVDGRYTDVEEYEADQPVAALHAGVTIRLADLD